MEQAFIKTEFTLNTTYHPNI